jgi:hypothetical protein
MSVLGFNAALSKQPGEQITVKADFNNVAASLVVSGYVLNNATVTIYDSVGVSTGNNMIQGAITADSNNKAVLVCIKSGSDGQDYYGKFATIWTKNAEPDQIIERDLLIKVRQEGF